MFIFAAVFACVEKNIIHFSMLNLNRDGSASPGAWRAVWVSSQVWYAEPVSWYLVHDSEYYDDSLYEFRVRVDLGDRRVTARLPSFMLADFMEAEGLRYDHKSQWDFFEKNLVRLVSLAFPEHSYGDIFIDGIHLERLYGRLMPPPGQGL
jgi:hypothetical protein